MPGYVEGMVIAQQEIHRFAAHYDQQWDVDGAFRENLRESQAHHPELSHWLQIQHAVKTTKHEILSNWEIQNPRAREYQGQRQEIDFAPVEAKYRFREGYEAMREHLRSVTGIRESMPDGSRPLESLRTDRVAVQRASLEASQMLSREMYPNTIVQKIGYEAVGRVEISGMRKAINEWSHEHNHSLKEQIKEREQHKQQYREVQRIKVG